MGQLLGPVNVFPVYQFDQGEPFNLLTWYNLLGGGGYALWLVAYVLIIRKCHADKTYGVPFAGLCLNFTWELMDSFVLADPVPFFVWVDRGWFLLDCVLVYQFLRHGQKEQTIPELKKYFYWVVAGVMLLGFWGQYAFVTSFHDTLGFIDAFCINLVESIMWCFLFFARRDDRRGLSLGGAVCKMLGTMLAAVQCVFLLPKIHPTAAVSYSKLGPYSFFNFLYVAIFVFDLIYVLLLVNAARRASSARASA